MGKIKSKVANFFVDRFFKEEVKELKDRYYSEEKNKVTNEIRSLENSLVNIQNEYKNLQHQKFNEMVNSDLSKQQTQDKVQEKNVVQEKDPFADWS